MTDRSSSDKSNPGAACLRRLSAFDTLSDPVVEALASICRQRVFEKDAVVARESERLEYVGFIASGILRMQKVQVSGRFNIVGLLVEGDMYGRVHNGPLHFDLEAAARTEVCTFPRDRFEALTDRSPDLERLVLLNILNELDAAREWMLILTNHRVTERLAGFLLMLCRRWSNVARLARVEDGRVMLNIPVSRSDLAHFLGTRQESVSRAFHALADQGLLRLESPSRIEILDLTGLIDLSGTEDLFVPGALDKLKGRI